MKNILSFWLVMLALGCPAGRGGAEGLVEEPLTKQVSDILNECKKLAHGATRADLLKVFIAEAGGLSNARHRTFVHRRCRYIKVDVDFAPSGLKQGTLEERLADTVEKISKPYLEWTVFD